MLTRRPARRAAARARGQRGSVLLLYPTAVLVVLVLAAIGVDFSHVDMARASLNDLTATAANDLATEALDIRAYRATGVYQLDERSGAIARIIGRTIDNRGDRTLRDVRVVTPPRLGWDNASGRYRLTLTMAGKVDFVFARAIPGASDDMDLVATSEVTLEDR